MDAQSAPSVPRPTRAPTHGCASLRPEWRVTQRHGLQGLSNEMLVCLAFEQPVQFGYRCLVRPCAHVERSTHACSVPRFEVVTRSESVASVRFRSRVLATAARKL